MQALRFTLLCSSLAVSACGSVATGTDKPDEPTITSISPDHGSVVGGTMVTITGTKLRATTPIVVVGGREATMTTVVSDTMATFVAPPGDLEGQVVDVTFGTEHGFGTLPQSFTYNFQPVVLSITPSNGKSTGGTVVTITGRGFMADSGTPTVTIAGGTATNVQVIDDKTIMATTGPAPASTLAFTPSDVTVKNANGENTLQNAFSVTNQGLIAIYNTNRTTFGCCGSDGVFYVDPATGHTVQISTTTRHVHGCTLSGNGLLFVIGTDGVGNSILSLPRNLMTLDPLTGNTTVLGPITEPGPVNRNPGALAFVGNTLYATDSGQRMATAASKKLLVLNPANGAASEVGAAFTVNVDNGIATKDASTVYIADAVTGSLDTLAVATGVRTAGLAFAGGAADNVHGLVNTGSSLYLAARTNKIYSIALGANATLTSVNAVFPTGGWIVGLCQTPPSF